MAAVAEQEGKELASVPVAGNVEPRLGDGAEEPAEVESVGPDGDVDLVSAEEGYGCTYAMDGRAVVEATLKVEAETLLGASADCHDDMPRTESVETF
jgi:hypothetical protein